MVQKYTKLSKIWAKLNKPFRVGLYISTALIFSFACMHLSDGKAGPIFLGILEKLPSITLASIPFSIFLFNYVDGISKDAVAASTDRSAVDDALISLGSLKRETVETAIFIVGLLFVDYLASGIESAMYANSTPLEYSNWIFLSVRFSIFFLSVYAISDQVRALLLAIEFRKIIPKPAK